MSNYNIAANISDLIEAGTKIRAIKELREHTHLSLKDAKDVIDSVDNLTYGERIAALVDFLNGNVANGVKVVNVKYVMLGGLSYAEVRVIGDKVVISDGGQNKVTIPASAAKFLAQALDS